MRKQRWLLVLAGLGILCVLTLCMGLSVSRAEGDDERERACFLASYQQELAKNYDGAITSLAGVPDSYLAQLRLGWLHYMKGNYASALTAYASAIKKCPDSIEARLGDLLPLLAKEDHPAVEKVAQQILGVDSVNYLASLRLAYSLRLQKKNDQALEVLDRMVKRYPTDTSLRIEQALNYTAKGQRETALPLYNGVLLLDPYNATAKPYADAAGKAVRENFSKSYTCEGAKDYTGALAAIANMPKSYLVELRRGWLCYLKGEYPEAVTHYRAAIDTMPTSTEAKLGSLLPMLAAQDYTETVVMARKVLADDKENYLANLRLAYALRLQKETKQAAAILERLVQHYPTDVSLLTEQGLVAQANEDHDAAVQIFNKVLMLDPTNETAKAQLGIK